MTNSYDVDHGLSQCPPGPLEPVEIAQQDDTLARTGNTARDQEMYAAGIAVGEANAKHNAAIRASMPDGWELVTRKTCYALMHDGAVIATLAGPESETNAAIIARMLAAPGVSTVEADAVKRLRDAIKGEFGGTWISEKQAIAVLTHLGGNAPAAGDALDAARYRWLTEDHADPVVRKHRNDILRRMSVMSHSAASADIDAAIAAQRQGDA